VEYFKKHFFLGVVLLELVPGWAQPIRPKKGAV